MLNYRTETTLQGAL